MVVRFTADKFCSLCGHWITCSTSEYPQKRRAIAIAKDKGWKRKRGEHGWMIDICPGCQKEKKNVQQS